MRTSLLLAGALAVSCASASAATFVSGLVPDWNQPNWHGVNQMPPNPPNGGPVADPTFKAWCVPTSAANVLGHWEDVRLESVSDGAAYPLSGANWPSGPSYQDYQANGTGRGTLPATIADDLGWYVNTNALGVLGGAPHSGTLLGQVSPGGSGLNQFFNVLGRPDFSVLTHGHSYADPQTAMLAGSAAGFIELMGEIDANRTAIAHFTHWNLSLQQAGSALVSGIQESDFGWDYYTFGPFMGTSPEELDEIYNNETGDAALGHAATVVGYITADSAEDVIGGTNWVIVHDNYSGTPRNVAVPMGTEWVANTIITPEPSTGMLFLLAAAGIAMGRRGARRSTASG